MAPLTGSVSTRALDPKAKPGNSSFLCKVNGSLQSPLCFSRMQEALALDATSQAELVRSKSISPSELVTAALEQINTLDNRINAVIHRRAEAALAEASSPTLADGPFRGVPLCLKGYSEVTPPAIRLTMARESCGKPATSPGKTHGWSAVFVEPASSSSDARIRRNSASSVSLSPNRTVQPTIHRNLPTLPAAPAAAAPLLWPPAWLRLPAVVTEAARSASRRACAALWG